MELPRRTPDHQPGKRGSRPRAPEVQGGPECSEVTVCVSRLVQNPIEFDCEYEPLRHEVH